jgi:hypothetical protein
MDLYTVGGQRWIYTFRYWLESWQLNRYCTHYRCESYSLLALVNLLDSLLDSLLHSMDETLLERAALRELCFGRSRVFCWKLLADGKLLVCGCFGQKKALRLQLSKR